MKPIDQDAVRRAALECGLLVRVENHSVVGGLGGAVCEVIVDEVPCRVKCLDFPDVFLESGDDQAMFARYSLDATGIEATVRKMLEERRPQ